MARRLLWLYAPMLAPEVHSAQPIEALLACPLASARLRMAVAAHAWREAGGANLFCDVAAMANAQADASNAGDICIVPKFTGDMQGELWLAAARTVKARGQKLVIDICDFPFRATQGAVPWFYGHVLPLADAVVVNSARMAEQIASHGTAPLTMIEDAVLGAEGAVHFAPAAPGAAGAALNLLWFGHPSNLRFLEPWINALIQQGPKPLRLTVVTQDGHGAREAAAHLTAQLAPSFEMAFVEWSLQATQQELARCDLALLPSDPADPRKSGASANRLAQVLLAGRFAVASPLHSYRPFADMAWVGDNLLDGVAWALAHPDAVRARIAAGQALVRERYDMRAIGAQWVALFTRLQ